jgi:hypothetical protein
MTTETAADAIGGDAMSFYIVEHDLPGYSRILPALEFRQFRTDFAGFAWSTRVRGPC